MKYVVAPAKVIKYVVAPAKVMKYVVAPAKAGVQFFTALDEHQAP